MRLFDTTVGTFLRPPFGRMATEILKRWSEEGTDSGIEEHDMLLAQQGSILFHNSVNSENSEVLDSFITV